MERITEFLEKRRTEDLLRILHPADSRCNGLIYFKGKEFIDLSSNDYLGLSSHPALKEASKKAVEEFGTSACASRLLSGDLLLHHRLEEETAKFKQKESALIFNTGYQANTGIIASLCTKEDVIFADKLAHASIIDGILLSGARFFRFHHNDTAHLESILKNERRKYKEALIITETIFSMDGDRAPLKDIVCLKRRYNCALMVDEAHATGIFGRGGSGVVEEEDSADDVDLIMGTFSKALGSFGAYLASSKRIIDYLINSCRSFIYSTALPPSVTAANLESLRLIRDEPYRRVRLLENTDYLRNELERHGIKVIGQSQIVPIIIGDSKRTVELCRRLQDMGYWVLPIRPPTVPEGESRLRLSITYNHTKDILERLIDDIRKIDKI